MVVVQNTAGAARRIQNQKRSDAMRAKKKQREEELKAQVEGWFDKFDVDNSQTLERDELKQLLTHLNPDCPPDESILKLLMSKNRESTAGVITKENVVRTVQKFNTYLRDKETLDRLFEQFDNDRSGVLEPAELLPLLKTWAPAVLASEDDVFFVLEHCDLDGDGMIERSELLPMLAMWKEIALDKELMEMQHKFFDDEGKPISSGGGASRLDTLQDIHSKKQEKGGKSGKVAPEDMAMTSAVPGGGGGKAAGSGERETVRRIIFQTFDDASYSTMSKVISIFMMLIIIISTVAFIAESETLEWGSLHEQKDKAKDVFYWIELSCVCIFSLDYAVRLLTCPKVRAFAFDPMNMVDLAAVLPFWIMFSPPGGEGGGGFGFVRVIRLIRVFRVFKLGRYSTGLQMFTGAMTGSVQPLGILVFVMGINMIIVSSIIHLFEVNYSPGYDLPYNDYCFSTIINTFWWAVVTMTTVGYGDCYPVSPGGKVVTIFTMLTGVLILALPITVIGSNFAKMVEMFEEETASYELTDGDGDGLVDEFELREFVMRKKKEGVLIKGAETRVQLLMAKYDPQGNGTLSKEEFTALKRDIINPTAGDPMAEIHEIQINVSRNAESMRAIKTDVEDRLARLEGMLASLGGALGVAPPPVYEHRRHEMEMAAAGGGAAGAGGAPPPPPVSTVAPAGQQGARQLTTPTPTPGGGLAGLPVPPPAAPLTPLTGIVPPPPAGGKPGGLAPRSPAPLPGVAPLKPPPKPPTNGN